jgi:hypothetical protein
MVFDARFINVSSKTETFLVVGDDNDDDDSEEDDDIGPQDPDEDPKLDGATLGCETRGARKTHL